MASDRTMQRWAAFTRARARAWLAKAKAVLLTDHPDQTDAEKLAAEELGRSAGELKGGMAKLAQLMAYLPGEGSAVDTDARETLAALWDRAPTIPAEAARQVVIDDLGKPPEDLFARWEAEPFAAASLGQVHGAIHRDGARLAVKVQFPGVAEGLRDDLASPDLVRRLAGAGVGQALDPAAIATLRDAVLGELDYRAEGEAMRRFGEAFRGEPDLVVPRWYDELSSRRVLTMERIDGRTLSALAATGTDDERAAVAIAIFRFTWGAPLRHRLLHADPNPGNYLWLGGGRVAFLDFGCTRRLDEHIVDVDRRMWKAVLARDTGFGGENFRAAVSEEGLLGRARTLDSDTYREWERYVTAPFRATTPFAWTPSYATQVAELTGQLVQAGGLKIPAPLLLLWRQRLGIAAVIASLGARADFRSALAALLAD